MFSDIVEIMAYLVNQIMLKEIKSDQHKMVGALLEGIKRLQEEMRAVISILQKDEECFEYSLWETAQERWRLQVNKKLRAYECAKEMIFYTLEGYDNHLIKDKNIFLLFPHVLRDRMDELGEDYLQIDTNMMIHGCHYNFINKVEVVSDDKNKELFIPMSIDIDSDEKKLSVINNAKKDEEKIMQLLIRFDGFIQEKYGVELKRRKPLFTDDF